MDSEVGFPVVRALAHEGRVAAGLLPAGRYARLIYRGNGLTGNSPLLDWGKATGIVWDRWADAQGDTFGARYETFLTDPTVEPRKTKGDIEVAIQLRDAYAANQVVR